MLWPWKHLVQTLLTWTSLPLFLLTEWIQTEAAIGAVHPFWGKTIREKPQWWSDTRMFLCYLKAFLCWDPSLCQTDSFSLQAKWRRCGGWEKGQNYSFLRKWNNFASTLSGVRFRERLQWCGLGKKKSKLLILYFHRVDQCFSLNENLLPSEMQMRLCCFSRLSTQRPHSQPSCVLTTPAWPAEQVTEPPGNWRSSTLSKHVCLVPLGLLTQGCQRALCEHALLSSRLTDLHLPILVSLYWLTFFLPLKLLLSRHTLHHGHRKHTLKL